MRNRVNSSKQVKRKENNVKEFEGQSFYSQKHYANVIVMTGAQLLTAHKDELLISFAQLLYSKAGIAGVQAEVEGMAQC